MALKLPKTLQTNLTDSSPTSRALANVKTAVDPLLNMVGSTFTILADGTLAFVRRVKTFAADSIVANSSLVSNGTFFVNGAAGFAGGTTTQGASVLVGNQNIIGNQTINGNSTITGTSSASSMVSGSGFKTYIPMGYYYNTAYTTATGFVQAVLYTVSTGGNAYQAANYVSMPFAGSIVGVTALYYGQSASIVCNVQIRGGNTTAPFTFTSGGQPWAASTAFAKGTYTFNVNQNLQPYISFGNAGNNLLYVGVLVEFGA